MASPWWNSGCIGPMFEPKHPNRRWNFSACLAIPPLLGVVILIKAKAIAEWISTNWNNF
jgi:hypothetical protein